MPSSTPWNQCAASVHFEEHALAEGRRVVTLRHPAQPFERVLSAAPGVALERALMNAAREYLTAITDRLRLPTQWRDALTAPGPRPGTEGVGWLPIAWGSPRHRTGATGADPRLSYWVARGAPGSPDTDRTAVLLAGAVWREGGGSVCAMGGEIGLRVVAHVRPEGNKSWRARFTAASMACVDRTTDGGVPTSGELEKLQQALRRLFRGNADRLLVRGARAVEGGWLMHVGLPGDGSSERDRAAVHWHRRPGIGLDATVFLSESGEPDSPDRGWRAEVKHQRHQFAFAAPAGQPLRLLERDPASAEPAMALRKRGRRRSDAALDAYRTEVQVPTAQPRSSAKRRAAGMLTLDQADRFRVIGPQRPPARAPWPGSGARARGAGASTPPAQAQAVELTGPKSLRSRHESALQAYFVTDSLFQCLSGYGLDPAQYFRCVRLPIEVDPCGPMSAGRGRDGRTVNAEVRFLAGGVNFWEPLAAGEQPGLRVTFALGELRHRRRPARDPACKGGEPPAKAEHLGIASDARWAWHEFGHVVIAATTGELELRFVHSVGDALAAIRGDMRSRLVDHPGWRGATFPWIPSLRRHDRDVALGWGWSGRMHRGARLAGGAHSCERKGYHTEQILSTTLFNLYRCLGGDTAIAARVAEERNPFPVPVQVAEAAEYATYLIMRALAVLGPATLVPAEVPEQLVSALIDADIGTERWRFASSAAGATVLDRTGGCAHKLIRWAFEAQGLYAPGEGVIDGPGAAPPVDVFIEDRRDTLWPARAPGTYPPVPLEWGDAPLPCPAWSALDRGIRLDLARRQIVVRVGNRGAQAASGVALRFAFAPLPVRGLRARLEALRFDPSSRLSSTGMRTFSIAPGATTEQRIDLPDVSERYLVVVVEASAPEDRANTDPATGLPSARLASGLAALVSGDNNLAVAVLDLTPAPRSQQNKVRTGRGRAVRAGTGRQDEGRRTRPVETAGAFASARRPARATSRGRR